MTLSNAKVAEVSALQDPDTVLGKVRITGAVLKWLKVLRFILMGALIIITLSKQDQLHFLNYVITGESAPIAPTIKPEG